MISAWLIERKDARLCYAKDEYTCGAWVTFTDPNARRFATQAEAEQVIADRHLDGVIVTSHGWTDAPLKECFVCGATLTGVAAERGHGNGDCAAEVRKLRLVLGQSAAMCREHYQDGVRAAVAKVREAAALYRGHEGTTSEAPGDYAARVALDSCASNIELVLLPVPVLT